MKGRLNQAIWTLGTINAIALVVVLYLAYSAGASANGATAHESPRRKPFTARPTMPTGPAMRSGRGVFTASATR